MADQLPHLTAATAAGAAPEMGVFVGIQQMEYASLAAPHLASFGPYNATGSPFSVAAGRLSFTYGLKGDFVMSGTAFRLSPRCTCGEHIWLPTRGLSACFVALSSRACLQIVLGVTFVSCRFHRPGSQRERHLLLGRGGTPLVLVHSR